MRSTLSLLLAFAFWSLMGGWHAGADEPAIALHPVNHRYFLFRGQPTILITSGEHYGALCNRSFDYVRYLDALAAEGLNHTRTFAGTYREVPGSFGITDNTLAPAGEEFVAPWARSEQPGNWDGGRKFDLDRWNDDYFVRLHDLLNAASVRGIVVELNLFCPLYEDSLWTASPMNAANNLQAIGTCPREEVYTLKHPDLTDVQKKLIRKLVASVAEFDNVYFEICNEPYFGGVTVEWQHAMVDTIVDAQTSLPPERRKLISMNIANGRAKVEQPHSHVSIFNFHYCVPPDTVAMNGHLKGVIGENETGFRGSADSLYRTEGWDFLLAGGGLYNNLDYSFSTSYPDGTLTDFRSPGGGSSALRRQLGILKRFLESMPIVEMQPDGSLVKSTDPAVTTSCLSKPGEVYAIYLHTPLEEKPAEKLASLEKATTQVKFTMQLPTGKYRAEWIDTKTGATLQAEEIQSVDNQSIFTGPEFQLDIALRLTRGTQ